MQDPKCGCEHCDKCKAWTRYQRKARFPEPREECKCEHCAVCKRRIRVAMIAEFGG